MGDFGCVQTFPLTQVGLVPVTLVQKAQKAQKARKARKARKAQRVQQEQQRWWRQVPLILALEEESRCLLASMWMAMVR